jgi:hypothetical protein
VVLIKVLVDTRATGCITQQLNVSLAIAIKPEAKEPQFILVLYAAEYDPNKNLHNCSRSVTIYRFRTPK